MHPREPQPEQPAGDRTPGSYPPGQPDQTREYPTVGGRLPAAAPPPGTAGPGAARPGTAGPGAARPASGGPAPGVYGRPPRPPRAPLNLKVRLTDALIAGGALLVFLFSFAPFVEYDNRQLTVELEEKSLPTWFSAWALETFMAPLTWWVIIAAFGMLGIVALKQFVPDQRLLGFHLGQVQLVLSYFALIVLLGYALSAKTLVFGSELQDESVLSPFSGDMSSGWGAYLMLFGALLAAVGATLGHLRIDPLIWPPPDKPQAVAYPAAQPGWGQQPGQAPHPGYPAPPYPQQPGQAYPPPQGYAPPTQAMPQATPPAPQGPPTAPQGPPTASPGEPGAEWRPDASESPSGPDEPPPAR